MKTITYRNFGAVLLGSAFVLGLVACGGGGGSSTVDPPMLPSGQTPPTQPGAPTLRFSASSGYAIVGTPFKLSWTSTNAESCVASGGWSGTKEPSGSEDVSGPEAGTMTLVLTCTGKGGDAQASIDVLITEMDGANGFNEWYGTPTPAFVPDPPEKYAQFEGTQGVRYLGGPEGLDHVPTESPGAGKFIFNRVYRANKHGLGEGEQFGIFSSWLESFGTNSIEGGLWVNPQAAGPTYYPSLHLGAIGDPYHICNDVAVGGGLYGYVIGDKWLAMTQIANRVLTIPGSNIAFDMNQNLYQDENGIWVGFGWTYLNLRHPKDYKYWLSFVETDNYQGPINGYVPEHFNWVDPEKLSDGRFQALLRRLGGNFGTFATKGAASNNGTGNETYQSGVLSLDSDLFYAPVPNFPIKKEREYLLAHPQSISQAAMEEYSRLLIDGTLENSLIESTNLPFNSLYKSSHQSIKIYEQVGGEEYRYYVDPPYTVGFEGHLGFIDWDFSDPEALQLARDSNGYAYIRKLAEKYEFEPGATDDYAAHDNSFKTEFVAAPDNTIRAPKKVYKFLNYNERDTTHPDFANWSIEGKTRYETVLQSGAEVTYVWFRFIEQPAMLTAVQNHPEVYTQDYLNSLQSYVENLHALVNSKSAETPSDPTFINYRGAEQPGGKDLNLAKIDPTQMVTPPQGFEVGYVPIVVSVHYPEQFSVNTRDIQRAPSFECSNSNWTDSFYPDVP